MDTSDLLKRAWEAVGSAGLPEHLQETAFREAVADLRGQAGRPPDLAGQQDISRPRGSAGSRDAVGAAGSASGRGDSGDDFFSRLVHETGADEDDLRHVLELVDTQEGQVVQVVQPARLLGSNKAEQTRTVVALVGGGRRAGLGEDPVSADAVRAECKRKSCFDGNFAAHIDRLEGFTLPDRSRLALSGTRWVPAFNAAVDRLNGRAVDE